MELIRACDQGGGGCGGNKEKSKIWKSVWQDEKKKDKWEWEAIRYAGSRWSIAKKPLVMQEKEGRTRCVIGCQWESAARLFVSGTLKQPVLGKKTAGIMGEFPKGSMFAKALQNMYPHSMGIRR